MLVITNTGTDGDHILKSVVSVLLVMLLLCCCILVADDSVFCDSDDAADVIVDAITGMNTCVLHDVNVCIIDA